jgi:hypothetical protein
VQPHAAESSHITVDLPDLPSYNPLTFRVSLLPLSVSIMSRKPG